MLIMYKYIVVVLLTIVSVPFAGLNSFAQVSDLETQNAQLVFEPSETCGDHCSDRGSGRRDQYKDTANEMKERGSGRLETDSKDSK
jgi:hypothetical protein